MNKELRSLLKVKDSNSIKLMKLKIKFNLNTLNMVLAFIYKESVLRTRKTLRNIYKLFTNLDESLYNDNMALMSRIWVIKQTLYAKLSEGIESNDALIMYCLDSIECDEVKKEVIESIKDLKISHDESKYLIKSIDDALEFGYTITVKDIMLELLNQIDDEEFKSYKMLADDLHQIAAMIINIQRSNSSLGSDQTFSLVEDVFDNVLIEAVQKLKDRNRIFITGIRRLNTILSPGFMSKRLYLFLAFPGKGKSMLLLYAALSIRRYNKIQTKDPDKRPAILFLTLENDIAETIERIYNMSVDNDDIRNYTPKQIKNRLRKEGHLGLSESNNIDIIIKEYKNRELDTNDLYTIINDLSDDGVETIALIVDYIKRIRPSERADGDEKKELKNISNELKEIAKFYDLPVITAQQLNRSSATVVDSALQANKEDVTKLVGRDGISGAWELLENCDFACVINPEMQVETGKNFMTFKMLKRRYKSTEDDINLRRMDYFNQPFEEGNDIKLIEDIDLPKSVALESLSTKFSPMQDDNKRGELNVIDREEKKEKKKKNKDYISVDTDIEFEPFNFENALNF